jgi:hypothetical protein
MGDVRGRGPPSRSQLMKCSPIGGPLPDKFFYVYMLNRHCDEMETCYIAAFVPYFSEFTINKYAWSIQTCQYLGCSQEWHFEHLGNLSDFDSENAISNKEKAVKL